MMITAHNLLRLAVFTQSGQKLGTVTGFIVNTDWQEITEYLVRGETVIKRLIKSELHIPIQRVLTITDEKMVVEDMVIREAETLKRKPSAVPNWSS